MEGQVGSSSSNEKQGSNDQSSAASTIDFIQNLRVDHLVAARHESDEDVPSYTHSALERKPSAANLRHLDDNESSSVRSSTTTTTTNRQSSLPSLSSSATSTRISHYSKCESDGSLEERSKRRRMSSDADSSVLTPLYQAVSAGAPLEVIQSLVQADPSSVGRKNGGGLTPLHCAIERYDTPVAVLLFLLESLPSTAAERCQRGFMPVDLLWKRYVEPDAYRSDQVKAQAAQLRLLMEQAVSNEDQEQVARASRRQARATLALHKDRMRAFWELMTTFICGACHGTTDPTSAGTRLVHDAVSIECSPLLIRFCAALSPNELLEQEEASGRMPLHIAAANGSHDILHTLLELEPQACSIPDMRGQLPLHLAIQAQLPWEGALDLLVATYPHSLTVVDPVTRLLPAVAASDCSIDVIYNLLRVNPVEVCRFALEGMRNGDERS